MQESEADATNISATPDPVRVAIIGLEHGHALGIALALHAAGAEIVAYSTEADTGGGTHGSGHDWAPDFGALFPDAVAAASHDELLRSGAYDLAVPVGVPGDRYLHAITALQAGKSVLADKPIAIDVDQLDQLRHATTETDAVFAIWFSERFESPATAKAIELLGAGAIGKLVEVIGLGPHRLSAEARPAWFFDPGRAGTLLTDLMTHQVEQFIHLVGVAGVDPSEVRLTHARQAHHGRFDGMNDHASLGLEADTVSGFLRVDWLSPDGLDTWGDVRLMLLGTNGSIEVRKNTDLASGQPGGNHVLLADHDGVQRVDCENVELGHAKDLLAAVAGETNWFSHPENSLRVLDLCLQAESLASRL